MTRRSCWARRRADRSSRNRPYVPGRSRDTQFDVHVEPALRLQAALEDGYALYDTGALTPDGPVDVEACRAYFQRYADEMQRVEPTPTQRHHMTLDRQSSSSPA